MATNRNWQDEPLDALGLSVRAFNCVTSEGLSTIGQLCARSPEELLEHRSFGETTLLEVKERLAEHGLRMRSFEPMNLTVRSPPRR